MLQAQVAHAASRQKPKESIRLYLELAEGLIQARGRNNYAQAAEYLQQVRETYFRMGEEQAWRVLIASLRNQHHNLPALQDELDRARL